MTYQRRHDLAALGIAMTLVGWTCYCVWQYDASGTLRWEWLIPYALVILMRAVV